MPHATTPTTGFQALILCGPGESLNPFNSNPRDFPKPLIPIANRPMVWYPLDFCYRMGINNIHLVAPPECSAALEAALNQNPHLTSLPSPKPSILAPEGLSLTTGTAEIFKLKQVLDAVTGDFVVLPCDLVSEMSGLKFLDAWMSQQGSVGVGLGAPEERGGLGVWYETKDSEEGFVGVRKEETDLLMSSELPKSVVPHSADSTRTNMRLVNLTMPMAALKDRIEDDGGLKKRPGLTGGYRKVKAQKNHRDAHIYFFPEWVKEFIRCNEKFESISEDVLGWWTKACWQRGLAAKLSLVHILKKDKGKAKNVDREEPNNVLDLSSLSSTSPSGLEHLGFRNIEGKDITSKNVNPGEVESQTPENETHIQSEFSSEPRGDLVPPLIAYLHPPQPKSPLLRRIDSVPLLLSASLHLAKKPPLTDLPEDNNSPFSHAHKIPPSTVIPSKVTLHSQNSLLDENVGLVSKSTISESVIGANCQLGTRSDSDSVAEIGPSQTNANYDGKKSSNSGTSGAGVRISRCLLMEGAAVESGVVLNGCILGRRCRIGTACDLRDCYIQEGFAVPSGTNAKGEVFAGFEEGTFEDESGATEHGLNPFDVDE